MAGLLDTLAQTWPARLAQTAWNAAKLPGDVYQGNIPVTGPNGYTNPEVINRSADLAGLMTMGATAAPAEMNAVGMGIRAYHGSPYDFDKFDLSKIGTGEGAQAYGHGLYFAENPQVAQGYRAKLASVDSTAKGYLDRYSDPQSALAAYNADIAKSTYNFSPYEMQQLEKTREAIKNNFASGRMYEVNINADPAQFLDWDKGFAGQSADVQGALRNIGLPEDFQTGSGIYNAVAQKTGLPHNMGFGPTPATPAEVAASNALKDSGVPGIRYLDGGSRGASTGTRNYVVFNPHLIDIVKKYGIAGMLGAASAPAWLPQGNASQ